MKYIGGNKAGKGTYWNFMTGQRVELEQEGMLPGDEKARYIKASGAVVLLLGPVLGLLFAVFLPFIGIAMAVTLAGKKVAAVVSDLAARSMSFGWRPVESYLGGKQKRKKGTRDLKETKDEPPR
jgi:fructose-1,6-bisphosphatase/inositol monophosphatase family enzyme